MSVPPPRLARVTPADRPSTLQVQVALWTVYLVWGSTYLSIRIAVHPEHGAGLPPLPMAGVRFVLAGGILLAFVVRRPARDGAPDPLGPRQWLSTAVVGVALLLGGNGLVTVAEQRVPSGVAALVVAIVPILTAVIAAVLGSERVGARHALGLALGFGGVAALVVGTGTGRVDALGLVLLLLAATSWSSGSYWSRTAAMPRRPLVTTGMEMLCGGVALVVVGLARGEAATLHLTRVPASAWLAFGYLIVAGSMLGYTAYVWLLHNAPLSLATTYAYVNPLVAVILGALILGEAFTPRAAVATAAIVGGVVLIVTRRSVAPPAPPPVEPAPEPVPARHDRAEACS
jgi:drug/metabolite transporter (DMT)-like permease